MSVPDPRTRSKVETLRSMSDRIHHVHALVERVATARDPGEADAFSVPLKRELGRFKRELASRGFDILSQKAGEMQNLAGRRGSQRSKSRMLRESIATLRNLADVEKRRVLSAAKRPDRSAAPDAPPGAGD